MKLCTLVKIIKSIKDISKNVFPPQFTDFSDRVWGSGTYLSQVEFHLVDHCNLNCAHCDHFTPLAPENFIEVEKIIGDFKKLRKIFDKIGKIYILGGEPLLHPHIQELYSPLRNLYPESEIIVITNGVLLEKTDEDFWAELKKYNIALSMTKYPIKVPYEKYINKCSALGIKSYYFNPDRFRMQKMELDYKGEQDKEKSFLKCNRKRCHFIRDSKLYVCTPVPNIQFLNDFFNINFPVTKKDYIDLNKIKSAAKINKILNKPIEFCKYCPDGESKFEDYAISKKVISEWVCPQSLEK